MRFLSASAAALLLLVCPAFLAAQELRQFNPIPTPARVPPGAEVVAPSAIDPGAVRGAVERLAANWNVSDLGETVSDSYYDKSRFRDAMITEVPRDARMRVESMGGIQTHQQMLVDDPAGGRLRISTVTVTAQTRLELNDPTEGFVRVPGTNEIILEVVEKIE